MIVQIGLLKRRADLSIKAFRNHWLGIHGPLAAQLPGVLDYWQNHVIERRPDSAAGDIDGFSRLEFTDREALRQSVKSEAFPPTVADAPNFIADSFVLTCDAETILAPPRNAPFKAMSIITRRADVSPDSFRQQWLSGSSNVAGLAGHRQNVVISRGSMSEHCIEWDRLPIDGIGEFWFSSLDDLRAAFESPGVMEGGLFRSRAEIFLVEPYAIVTTEETTGP